MTPCGGYRGGLENVCEQVDREQVLLAEEATEQSKDARVKAETKERPAVPKFVLVGRRKIRVEERKRDEGSLTKLCLRQGLSLHSRSFHLAVQMKE